MPKKNKPVLTKAKRAHVEKTKPAVIKGGVLHYPASVADKYSRELKRLVDLMTRTTEKEITNLFETSAAAQKLFTTDASIASEARILTNKLQAQFEQLFNKKAKGLAEGMIRNANKASKTALHSSLKELSGGLSLKTSMITGAMKPIVQASITENVSLIKSIPVQYQTQVQGAVMRSISTGNGLEDLVPFLQKYKGVTLRRANLIALDQTKKVYANLNEGRMRAVGLNKYEWVHSGGGQEPRELHVALSGKIFSLDDPPIIQYAKGSQPQVRGKPGDLINCTCTSRPVIEFNQEPSK